MSYQLLEMCILTTAVLLSFALSAAYLSFSDVIISVGLFISLFLLRKISFRAGKFWTVIESFIFIFITLFVVLTTGAAVSPFFFLIYFLVFSLALMVEPIVSLSITCTIILLFVMKTSTNTPFSTLLPIFSLAFLVPFALLLAKERIENEKLSLKDQLQRENTYLFLSLTLKKHLESIKNIATGFKEEKDSQQVKKQVDIIEKLIDKYERE